MNPSQDKNTMNPSISQDDGSNAEGNDNVWSSLPFPLSDLFLQEIAPKYLTLHDLLRLGAVNKRYHNLLGPTASQGNRILGVLLQRESKQYHPISGELLYTEQLPTIGNRSVEESLKEDALLVARLRTAASRRRGLVLLPADQQHQQETIARFRPKPMQDMVTVAQKYCRSLRNSHPLTEFLGVNLSGVDIYCHWIDEEHGQLVVREGDCIPPKEQLGGGVSSFVVRDSTEVPFFIFRHRSLLYHSFALCFQEGGPPFCIYQQRRGWLRIVPNPNHGTMHTHAIAILPGGVIQELYCDSTLTLDRLHGNWRRYDFLDRQTGEPIPRERDGEPAAAAAALPGDNTAKKLAKAFYGAGVPSLSHSCWRREANPQELVAALGTTGGLDALGWINPLGEALWREDHTDVHGEWENEMMNR